MNNNIPKLFVGTSVNNSDLRYVSHFLAPDSFVFLDKGLEKFILLSALEVARGRKELTKRVQVLSYEDVGLAMNSSATASELMLALLNWAEVNQVRVQRDFPLFSARLLMEQGIVIECEDCASLYPERLQKSEQEIGCLRASQAAAVKAVKRVAAILKSASIDAQGQLLWEGSVLTSEQVRLEVELLLLKLNCSTPDGTIVACGEQAADPHNQGTGPLRAGEPIVVDIFPRNTLHGYWGDISRTFVKGAVSDEKSRLIQTVKEVQHMTLEWVTAGASGMFIHNQVLHAFDVRGYKTALSGKQPSGFFHGTGHGVGLDIHELPRISRTEAYLQTGNVVTIEPGLYYPGLGGARFEDTIVVRDKGFDYLCACDVPWHID